MNIKLSKTGEGNFQAVVFFPWGEKVACIGTTAEEAIKLAAYRVGRAEYANLDLDRALRAETQ
jgi:hypothetical protein